MTNKLAPTAYPLLFLIVFWGVVILGVKRCSEPPPPPPAPVCGFVK